MLAKKKYLHRGKPIPKIKELNFKSSINYDIKEMNIDQVTVLKDAEQYDQKQFLDLLTYLSNQYYYAVPIVADEIFDELVKIYEGKFGTYTPASKIEPTGLMVTVPYFISSLRKIIEDKEITNYLNNYPGPYIVEDKIDGLTLLLVRENSVTKLYTHGKNGLGRDITHLLNYVKFPVLHDDIVIRGEIVITKENFDKYGGDYKNSRNMVGGIVNSTKNFDPNLASKLSFYAYRILTSDDIPEQQIGHLQKLGFQIPSPVAAPSLSKEMLKNYYDDRILNAPYDIDGLVVYQNVEIDYPDGDDPKQVVAFKTETAVVETKVSSVFWKASKDRKLKPSVRYDKSHVSKADLTKASGYNAKFIIDNKIGAGAVVLITRSGDVIPKILGVIKPAAEYYPDPEVYGKYEWGTTEKELYILEDNDDVLTGKLRHFITTLDIKHFGPARLKSLVEAGITTVDDLLNLTTEDIINIPGMGETLAGQLLQSIQEKITDVPLPKIMDASGFFSGIGVKRFEMIMAVYPGFLEMLYEDDIADKIREVKGFDSLADKIAASLPEFADWLHDHPEITIKEPEVTTNELAGKSFVFSGFRDKPLEEEIKKRGGKVGTSVSGNTSMLIVKDMTSQTGKPQEARSKGVAIILRDEFVQKYLM